MATIHASGSTVFGRIEVRITGDETVTSIEADDDIKAYFAEHIHSGDGWLANGYQPEPDTMLQAFAFCSTVFNHEDITVSGDIGTIPFEPGVIY